MILYLLENKSGVVESDSMYSIVFTKSAKRDINNLPNVIFDRIVLVLERIKSNPRKYVRPLRGIKSDIPVYRLRVGDYRVILGINDEKKELVILRVSHRKNVYNF